MLPGDVGRVHKNISHVSMRHYHPLPRNLSVISPFSHSHVALASPSGLTMNTHEFIPYDVHWNLSSASPPKTSTSKSIRVDFKFTPESFDGTATAKRKTRSLPGSRQTYKRTICLTSQPACLYNCLCLSTCIPTNSYPFLQHSPLRSFVYATLLSMNRTHDWPAKNAKSS